MEAIHVVQWSPMHSREEKTSLSPTPQEHKCRIYELYQADVVGKHGFVSFAFKPQKQCIYRCCKRCDRRFRWWITSLLPLYSVLSFVGKFVVWKTSTILDLFMAEHGSPSWNTEFVCTVLLNHDWWIMHGVVCQNMRRLPHKGQTTLYDGQTYFCLAHRSYDEWYLWCQPTNQGTMTLPLAHFRSMWHMRRLSQSIAPTCVSSSWDC